MAESKGSSPARPIRPVRLGLMPPLSGLVGLYGPEISMAGRIACDEINEQGGVLGQPLELFIVDDGSQPETAVPAAIELIEKHHCQAIIGNLLSNSRIAVANQVADPRKIPFLNFSFYEGSIWGRYFFHFAALPNQQIDKMIPYMVQHFGPKIFFAGSNYEWPIGSINAAKQALLSVGGEIIGEDYLPFGTDDFSALLARVAKSGADVFVPYFAGSDQTNLLTQFTKKGLKEHMAVVMGHYDEAMVGLLSPEIREGFYSSNTYFMGVDTPENKNYLQRLAELTEVTGISPNGNGVLTNFGEGTYLCVKAFAKAANQAGSVDAEALVDALATISLRGPQGLVTMDPETHHARINSYLSRCKADGSFTIIEKFGCIDPVIPERYRQQTSLSQKAPPFVEPSPDLQSSGAGSGANNTDQTQDRTIEPETSEHTETEQTGVAQTDLSGRFTYINQTFIDILGIDSDNTLRQGSILTLLDPDDLDHGVQTLAELKLGARDYTNFRITGNKIFSDSANVSLDVTLFRNWQGQPVSFVLHVNNKKPSDKDTKLSSQESILNTLATAMINLNGRIIHVNNHFLGLWEYQDVKDIINQRISFLWDKGQEVQKILRHARQDGSWKGTLSAITQSGKTKAFAVLIESTKTQAQEIIGYTLTCSKQFGTQILSNNDTSKEILAVADFSVIAVNEDGVIVQANESCSTLFGYSIEELIRLPVNELLPPHFRAHHSVSIKGFLSSEATELRMGGRGEIAGYRKDGSVFPAEATISKFKGPDGWIMVASLRDISKLKKIEEDLVWHATHDPLTSLPNRELIQNRINNALDRSKKTKKLLALLFIDIDNFKLINDSYGHDIGDQVLIAIANRFSSAARPGDILGRFGGDEFVLLCDQLSDTSVIPAIVECFIDTLRQPLHIFDLKLFATTSIGVSVGIGNEQTSEDLLRNADAAMYFAKDFGRNNWQLYDDEIGEKSRSQLSIANGLRTAIGNNEFTAHYQPIVEMENGGIIGAEVLLRWQANGTNISPVQFIPVAEMTGMIVNIGQWVLRQACQTLVQWQQSYDKEKSLYISVNVSTRQLSEPDIIDTIKDIISDTGADPAYIVLEITETALMADVKVNQKILQELGNLGLKVAIDDFGTGYSSLGQLINLPVDTLKVDRVFVNDMCERQESLAVASAIISMAQALNLNVVAEGVETNEQREMLLKLGCKNAQGFHFYRPMPLDDFNAAFSKQKLSSINSKAG